MPYARKRSYSSRPFKRTRLYGKRRTFRKRPRARSVNVRTAGFLGAELKFVEQAGTNVSVPFAIAGSELDDATNKCLNPVAQGVGQSQRDGRQYIMKSIQVKGSVSCALRADSADAAIGGVTRVVLVMDKQTNGVQFNAEDVLDETIVNPIDAWRKLEFSKRFDILAEKTMTMHYTNSATDGSNTGSYAGVTKHFSFFKKLNVKVNCTTTGATIAAISDNSLHLFAFGFVASTNISWSSRLRFVG